MKKTTASLITILLGIAAVFHGFAANPDRPGINYVAPIRDQPYASGPQLIWHDSFDSGTVSTAYAEYGNDGGDYIPVTYEAFGGTGYCMRALWQTGEVGAGDLKIVFGDSPVYSAKRLRPGEKFGEIYWRMYVKYQAGWTGDPAKLSRATVFAGSNWSQAMIAHVWGSGDPLVLDPASGINSSSQLVTTKYNDFANLRWLGIRRGTFPIHSTAESGQWICVEAYVKLNTPGQANGVFTLWIDGEIDAHADNLNWLYSWQEKGLNAVFHANWWNSGSPVQQERYIDDFVIATERIGPARCPINPTIVKTAFSDPDGGDSQLAWQLQVATDNAGTNVVWDSAAYASAGNALVVSPSNGTFMGTLTGRGALDYDTHYWARVRVSDQSAGWSGWSAWRGVIMTEERDRDGDRMSDDWERKHFGTTNAAAHHDDDTDGMSNIDEFVAGTVPSGPSGQNSRFALEIHLDNGSAVVSIPTIRPFGLGYAGYSRRYARVSDVFFDLIRFGACPFSFVGVYCIGTRYIRKGGSV